MKSLIPWLANALLAASLAGFAAHAEAAENALTQAGNKVMDIIARALAAYHVDYKFRGEDGRIYTRWGLVEKDIRAAFTPPATPDADALQDIRESKAKGR